MGEIHRIIDVARNHSAILNRSVESEHSVLHV